MLRVTSSLPIDALPQQVWDLYANVEHTPEWVPFVEEVLWVSGPPGVGQAYRERTRLGGVSDVAEWRVVEWLPPRRQVQVSTERRMDSRLIIEIEPSREGSVIRQEAVLESRLPKPIAWLHEALFAVVARRG